MLTVLVCGGRSYVDRQRIDSVLCRLAEEREVGLVVTGGASGADSIATRWAREHGVPSRLYVAEWRRLGRSAGMARNATMLRESTPDLVVAFPGGTGTADMVRRAREAGVEVLEVPAWKPLAEVLADDAPEAPCASS